MKKSALIVKEDGLIYVNQVPEEPKHEHYGLTQDDTEDFWDDAEEHKKALASAKETAVLCADQEQARELLFVKHCIFPKEIALKQATGIYPIPGLQWTKVDAKIARILSTGDKHKQMPLKGEVAILHSPSTEKEESQEEPIKKKGIYQLAAEMQAKDRVSITAKELQDFIQKRKAKDQ